MDSQQWLEFSQQCMDDLQKGRIIITSVDARGKPNGMTVAWGFFGFMWNEPYFISAVRPQRYTWRLIKETGRFCVNCFSDVYQEALRFFGTESGYNLDKFQTGSLHLDKVPGFTAPIQEAHTLFECAVVTTTQIQPFELPFDYIEKNYRADNGYHTLFFGRLENAYHR